MHLDVNSYMHGAWGMMRAGPNAAETVILRFTPAAGRWVAEEDWHPSQQVRTMEDGSVAISMMEVDETAEFTSFQHYRTRYVEAILATMPVLTLCASTIRLWTL